MCTYTYIYIDIFLKNHKKSSKTPKTAVEVANKNCNWQPLKLKEVSCPNLMPRGPDL